MRCKLCLFFLIILSLTQSCTNPFAPAKASPGASLSNLLTDQSTPNEVLTNFKFAYTFKDSLVYSAIIDSSYIFLSKDFDQVPPVPIQWGRDLELKTTARLFKFFNTIDLTFNVISQDTIKLDSLKSPTEIQHKITFTLTLDGGTTIPTLNGEVEFTYIQNNEGKWLISKWEDLQI